jgi:hypothetical protein
VAQDGGLLLRQDKQKVRRCNGKKTQEGGLKARRRNGKKNQERRDSSLRSE